MFYVYYLRSINFPNKTYIGFTQDLQERLKRHNTGGSIYTADFRPWQIVGFFGFDEDLKARRFERYLKTNAGKIFLKRYVQDQDN